MNLHNGLDIEVYDLRPTDLHYYRTTTTTTTTTVLIRTMDVTLTRDRFTVADLVNARSQKVVDIFFLKCSTLSSEEYDF